MKASRSFVLLFLSTSLFAQAAPELPTEPLLVFISDTHFGPGMSGDDYHPYEDFRFPTEFSGFLDAIKAQGQGRTHLILNGDSFELWQPLDIEHCLGGRTQDEGCTESESLERLGAIVTGHKKTDFDALKRFAESGENRIFIVPGNHDAALLYGSVARAVVDAIGAADGRVKVLREGYYLSDDHRVYAEHGHQLDDSNALPGWPEPFRSEKRYLARPWGENLVQSFYNVRESHYATIDNIAGVMNGIKYGLAAEGFKGSVNAAGTFLKFFLINQSFRQFRSLLDEQDPEKPAVEWKIAAIRAGGDKFLVESLPSDDPVRPVYEAALAEGKLGLDLASLTDAEINRICDYRYALEQSQLRAKIKPTITPCPRTTLSALAKKVVSLVNEHKFLSSRIDAVQRELVRQGRLASPTDVFDLVILSHTHSAEQEFDPREKSPRRWHPLVANSGAWQRIASADYVKRLQTNESWPAAKVLTNLKFDRLPACYPAIFVRPHGTRKPKAELMRWSAQNGGVWELVPEEKATCNTPPKRVATSTE